MSRFLVSVSVLVLLAAFVGCDGSGVSDPQGFDRVDFDTDQFAVVDEDDLFANMDDATLDEELSLRSAFDSSGGFSRHHRHGGGPGTHLGPVLWLLGLDEAQREEIRQIIEQHREVVRGIFGDLREVNQPFIDAANEARQEILEALRAGEITREEAIRQLRELSQETRQTIRDNPANDPLFQQLCEATRTMFDRIRAVLTEEQAAKWDDWIGHHEGRCDTE